MGENGETANFNRVGQEEDKKLEAGRGGCLNILIWGS